MEAFSLSPQIHTTIYPAEELAKYSKHTICTIKAILFLHETPIKKAPCEIQKTRVKSAAGQSILQLSNSVLARYTFCSLAEFLSIPPHPASLPHQKNKTPGITLQDISTGCKNNKSSYKNKYYAYSYCNCFSHRVF